jgi:hypothetical protein
MTGKIFSLPTLAILGLFSTAAQADDYVLIAESDSGCRLFIDGIDLVAEGCNVHIRNGEGYTEIGNDRGNLIVGYDEEEEDDLKQGSHNLVVGPRHSYSSVGGLVAGHDNEISGNYASVTGGYDNAARGAASSISGGARNQADDYGASVAGGVSNQATGSCAAVSGGMGNSASGLGSLSAGGLQNDSSGYGSATTGGRYGEAQGFASISLGGQDNLSDGSYSVVVGGEFNSAGGRHAVLVGGEEAYADDAHTVVFGTNPELNGGGVPWDGSPVCGDLQTRVLGREE